jgi:threonine dehydrogenase-like Zn-dependent dehydrogenase
VLAVQYIKSIPRWLLLKSLGRRFPSLATSPFGVMQLRDVPEPKLPTPRWVRVRPILSGICGSDLASITAEGSPFFAPLTSFPFTFGHEVVGRVVEVGSQVSTIKVGERVVVEPALHCGVRGIDPPCASCQTGTYGNCVNVLSGDIGPGIQTGFCRDTGGGWSGSLVAHEVQLHRVPDGISAEEAVLVEPFACALHATLRTSSLLSTQYSVRGTQNPPFGSADPAAQTCTPAPSTQYSVPSTALILGCGTIGLLTIAALKTFQPGGRAVALAKHQHQQELARQLGADTIIPSDRHSRDALCKLTGATMHFAEIGPPAVLGGFDVVFDCVGSAKSLDEALRFTKARGTTILVGMPAIPKTVDWTTIWYKELQVLGTYAYGLEDVSGERLRTFELALRLLREKRVDLRPLVTHRFPLQQYRQAVRTALLTGRHRSVKTVFALGG